ILLEIGPGQTLTSMCRRHPSMSDRHSTYASMRHPDDRRSDEEVLLSAVSRLWTDGARVDWLKFSASERRRRVTLPTYPFERRRYRFAPSKKRETENSGASVAVKSSGVGNWFWVPVWKQEPPPELAVPIAAGADSGEWIVFA